MPLKTSHLDAILAKHTVASDQNTKNKLLGASFIVVNKNDVLYSGSAGRLGNTREARPWDDTTFTCVASLTKVVTATSIMQLVERGSVNLDSDVRDLAPRLRELQILKGFDGDKKPVLENYDTPITPRMLLTHTVGLGYDLATTTNLEWSLDGFSTYLKFNPGEGWHYGPALDWAGQVIEKVTGMTLGEYMSANVFEPLGMRDTGFRPEKMPHVANPTAAWAYRREDGSLGPGPRPIPELQLLESGGAGLWTTAQDYGKFLYALLISKIVEKETLDKMFRPQLNHAQEAMLMQALRDKPAIAVEFSPDIDFNYGLSGCINMKDVPGKRKKGSMMWSGLCNGHWWIDRETGIAAVLIVQVVPYGDPVAAMLYDELERAVYNELLMQV